MVEDKEGKLDQLSHAVLLGKPFLYNNSWNPPYRPLIPPLTSEETEAQMD
jgi:hypothetical protein